MKLKLFSIFYMSSCLSLFGGDKEEIMEAIIPYFETDSEDAEIIAEDLVGKNIRPMDVSSRIQRIIAQNGNVRTDLVSFWSQLTGKYDIPLEKPLTEDERFDLITPINNFIRQTFFNNMTLMSQIIRAVRSLSDTALTNLAQKINSQNTIQQNVEILSRELSIPLSVPVSTSIQNSQRPKRTSDNRLELIQSLVGNYINHLNSNQQHDIVQHLLSLNESAYTQFAQKIAEMVHQGNSQEIILNYILTVSNMSHLTQPTQAFQQIQLASTNQASITNSTNISVDKILETYEVALSLRKYLQDIPKEYLVSYVDQAQQNGGFPRAILETLATKRRSLSDYIGNQLAGQQKEIFITNVLSAADRMEVSIGEVNNIAKQAHTNKESVVSTLASILGISNPITTESVISSFIQKPYLKEFIVNNLKNLDVNVLEPWIYHDIIQTNRDVTTDLVHQAIIAHIRKLNNGQEINPDNDQNIFKTVNETKIFSHRDLNNLVESCVRLATTLSIESIVGNYIQEQSLKNFVIDNLKNWEPNQLTVWITAQINQHFDLKSALCYIALIEHIKANTKLTIEQKTSICQAPCIWPEVQQFIQSGNFSQENLNNFVSSCECNAVINTSYASLPTRTMEIFVEKIKRILAWDDLYFYINLFKPNFNIIENNLGKVENIRHTIASFIREIDIQNEIICFVIFNPNQSVDNFINNISTNVRMGVLTQNYILMNDILSVAKINPEKYFWLVARCYLQPADLNTISGLLHGKSINFYNLIINDLETYCIMATGMFVTEGDKRLYIHQRVLDLIK